MNEEALMKKLASFRFTGLALAVICIGAVVLSYLSQNKEVAAESLLYGWYFWATVTLGCFGVTLLHHTLRGSWGLSILRKLESGGGPEALLITGIAGALVLFPNLGLFYPWANPARVADDPVLQGKVWYLTEQGFVIRYLIYFTVFIILAALLRTSSRRQDENLDPTLGVKRNTLGPVGLIIFFVTMTFAITDWVMSLEPHWFSSILPLLTSVGGALSAVSLCVILLLAHRVYEPYNSVVTKQLTKDLGNVLFATTMLWQYMTLSQYLITYSGNLPEEVPYYLKRNEHGWTWLAAAVITFQFFVPFTALLAPRTKAYAKNLIIVAMLIFVVRFFDVYWTVLPSLRSTYKPTPDMTLVQSLSQWTDWVAFLGFAGLWFFSYGWQISRAAILPKHDTRLLEVEHAH
jgi:hypothetical protein